MSDSTEKESAYLASIALLSLSYLTKGHLDDERYVEDFLVKWFEKMEPRIELNSEDLQSVIRFAKMGEKKLERHIETLRSVTE